MLALGRGHFTVSSVLSGPHSQCHCSSYRGGQHREATCVSAWVPLEACMHLFQGPPPFSAHQSVTQKGMSWWLFGLAGIRFCGGPCIQVVQYLTYPPSNYGKFLLLLTSTLCLSLEDWHLWIKDALAFKLAVGFGHWPKVRRRELRELSAPVAFGKMGSS